MSEQIKFEPVFGDQSLFDGLDDEFVFACFNAVTGKKFGHSHKILTNANNVEMHGNIAMRRIIRTPTWTIADQKAGKLPEVGCRVSYLGIEYDVLAVDKHNVCFLGIDKELYLACISSVKPIESPEEKAARLRDEWVEKAVGATPVYEIATHGYSTQLRIDISSIYDAMISGDLPVPVKGE